MKKIPVIFVAGVMVFMLSSCGQTKNTGEVQTDTGNNIPQSSKEADETDSDGKKDTAYDGLDRLMGESEEAQPLDPATKQSSKDTEHDSDTPKTGGFKEFFIARFIQNSRVSFDYLDMISDQNNGQISIDELNYIQYSLTGTELDFSSDINGSIGRYEAASLFNYGLISGYDYEDTDNGVLITADLEIGYDGSEDTQKYEVTAELIRNPYSCFDGYSVAAFTSMIVDNLQGDTNSSAE